MTLTPKIANIDEIVIWYSLYMNIMEVNNKMATKKQIKISISEDEEALILAYAKATGNSISNAGRQLLVGGLENQETAKILTEKISISVNSLYRKQEDFENRIIDILMLTYKHIGAIKAISKTGFVDASEKNFDDIKRLLDNAEQSGINVALSKLNRIKNNKND